MTGRPEHPATGRLALLALCGELVIAIDAMTIHAIRRVAETTDHVDVNGRIVLELDGELIRGWDLGELLGVGRCSDAWVIADVPGIALPVGFRVGRCVLVQPLPRCRAIPGGIFTSRPDAIVAGFSVDGVPELAEHVSGVVVDLAHVLSDHERGDSVPPERERHDPAPAA